MSSLPNVVLVPAWKSQPSWYLVAASDEAIPAAPCAGSPSAERQFAARTGATTAEIPSSLVAMVSHPEDEADLIKAAAKEVPGVG